ncbi:MAG: SDR family oxidoreductase [Planctomycetota bacterium]
MTPPKRPLEGRVAIITGASAGIGAAVARRFARDGAKLVLNARRAHAVEAIERELDSAQGVETATCVSGDCADPRTIELMMQTAVDHFDHHPDLYVVNAGRGLSGSVTTSDPSEWEELVRTNLIGAARLLRAAAERLTGPDQPDPKETEAWLRRPRDIVVLGSTVGRHISPFSSMYGSTKFAVHSLAEALRRELAPKGIRVSLIEPGIVESEFQRVAGYDPESFGEFMTSIGPVLQPDDIAETITYICSRPAHVAIGDVVIRATRQEYP